MASEEVVLRRVAELNRMLAERLGAWRRKHCRCGGPAPDPDDLLAHRESHLSDCAYRQMIDEIAACAVAPQGLPGDVEAQRVLVANLERRSAELQADMFE